MDRDVNQPQNAVDLERVQVLEPMEAAPEGDGLSQFDVTTDSVVVTVLLSTAKRARRIFIDWGDDQSDTLVVRPGLPQESPLGEDPLPVGSYEFRHAYELSSEQPFMRTFLVHVESADGTDEIRLKTVRLVPRFRVVQYRTYLDLEEPCDILNSSSELRVTQTVGDGAVKHWKWEPNSSFYPVRTVLEGSQFRVEMTAETDPDSGEYTPMFPVTLGFKEIDRGPNQYGTHTSYIWNYGIQERNGEDINTTAYVDKQPFGAGCSVRIRYDRVVTLIRNVSPTGSDWPVFTPV